MLQLQQYLINVYVQVISTMYILQIISTQKEKSCKKSLFKMASEKKPVKSKKAAKKWL